MVSVVVPSDNIRMSARSTSKVLCASAMATSAGIVSPNATVDETIVPELRGREIRRRCSGGHRDVDHAFVAVAIEA